MLDAVAWADAEDLVRELVDQILAPYGVGAEVTYVRGVPPVVNEPVATALLGGGRATRCSARTARSSTPQSLGGEDFAWYLERRPRRDGPARHPHARAAAPTTCTRATCASTSGPSAVGAKVLAAAVLTTFDA